MVATRIPVGVITDIDILNDETNFKNLFFAVTQSNASADLLGKRKEISESVDKSSEHKALEKLRENISEFLEQLKSEKHKLGGARGALNRIRKETSKWNTPKIEGIAGFEDSRKSLVEELIGELREKNIFILPVGELEGWMDLGTSRKNKWIVLALNQIFYKKASLELIDFVKMVLTKVTKNNTNSKK